MSASTIVSNDTDETFGDELAESLKALTNQTMRRFGPYPAYKDSDVEWLGDIPALWETMRLKYLVDFRGGGTPPKEILEYWRGDIPWVSPKDMKVSIIVDTEDKITAEAVRVSATNFVPPGAVVIVVRSGILGHSIPAAVTGREVTLNQDLKALIPKFNITATFLRYFICGMQRQLLTAWRKEGATVESLELDLVASSYAPVPPLEDQRSIATFLDREATKIDALVAKKERLIDRLQEKRNALITRSVSKGLDPNVRMKDSGVDWLGDIPAHWELVPLKHLLRRCDYGISESLTAGGDIRVLTMAHIQQGEVVLPEQGSVNQIDDALLLDTGDLLFNRTNSRELVGKVGLFCGSRDDRITFASYLVRLTVREGTAAEWLHYLLNSAGLLGLARSMALLSVNQANLNPTRYTQISVPRPNLSEQSAIAAFLSRETARFNALIFKVSDAIDRLKELRTAMISAAVTGKIDVREEVV